MYTFPGCPISGETEEVAVRIPVARPFILNPSSDQGVNTDIDTDTDVATVCYRDDGHTHNQSKPLRKL